MSSLTPVEKRQFEALFDMCSGYVLDFTNRTFQEFILDTVGADIYSKKYAIQGDSKARRLRAFWAIEGDSLVGKVLRDMLELWSSDNPSPDKEHQARYEKCQRIVSRLCGTTAPGPTTEDEFLDRDLTGVSVKQVKIDSGLIPVLEARLAEAERCMRAGAPLATIFLSGSILEGLLLGTACANPQRFNQSASSPKTTQGKVRQFPDWTLSQLIDVAYAEGYLTLDVKKFSHALRDFRNYIHPFQQLSSQFAPNDHTARICMQVLKAAIACLSGIRST